MAVGPNIYAMPLPALWRPYPSAFSQLRQFVRRFHPLLLQYMQKELQLLIAAEISIAPGSIDACYGHAALRKISQVKLETAIKP